MPAKRPAVSVTLIYLYGCRLRFTLEIKHAIAQHIVCMPTGKHAVKRGHMQTVRDKLAALAERKPDHFTGDSLAILSNGN